MPAGLFTLTCPDCSKELRVVESGLGTCPTCDLTYLHRFGCLIPVGISNQMKTGESKTGESKTGELKAGELHTNELADSLSMSGASK